MPESAHCDLDAYLSYNGNSGSLDTHLRNCRRKPFQATSNGLQETKPMSKPAQSYPPLTKAEEKLWEDKIEPVVRRIVLSVYGKQKGIDFDDLMSVGCVSAVAAWRSFDPTLGTLEGFIAWKVRNRLNDHIDHDCVRRKHFRRLRPVHDRAICDGHCELERAEEETAVLAAVQRLRRFLSQREIDLLRLGGSMRRREIAQRWGCSERWVSNVKHDALRALERQAELAGVPKSRILAALLDADAAQGEEVKHLLCHEEKIFEDSTSPFLSLTDT